MPPQPPPADAHSALRNPFSTRYVRPGAIDYVWPPGESAEALIARLRQHQWWGEIVGPHGAGKSTLLAALRSALCAAGQTPYWIELHDGQRKLGVDLPALFRDERPTLLIVDGYEQLSWWSKLRLKRFCRTRSLGLIITTHVPQGLPPLHTARPSLSAVRVIVGRLLGGDVDWLGDDELQTLYDQHAGNVRELLFALYDRYESRRPT